MEQDCPYQDLDGKDFKSYHVCGYQGEDLVAYARIVNSGISYNEIAIGRVVTSPKNRGTGLGSKLMLACIQYVDEHLGKQPIRISAQSHLNKFYNDLGFVETGKAYLEDGIPHIEMLRD